MAEEIVACPGCAKKFKIPEGAPGGTFQCTACNANVPYGKTGKGTKSAAAGRSAAGTAVRQTRAAAPVAAPSRGGGSSRRRGRDEPEEEAEDRGRRGRKPKDNTQQTILWVSLGGIVVIGLAAFAIISNRDKTDTPETPPTAPPVVAPVAQPAVPPAASPGNPAAATPPAASGDPSKPAPPSGIGGTKSNVSFAGSANMDALFVRIPDVEGVTPQEREAMDKDVATLCDFDSGKAGNDAATRLRKLGRKAVPALLSAFEGQWKATKWDDDKDKWKSSQIQDLLISIAKADRPGTDNFKARYVPQDSKSVPSTDFQKAARMWVNWWNGPGKGIEKFTDFAE